MHTRDRRLQQQRKEGFIPHARALAAFTQRARGCICGRFLRRRSSTAPRRDSRGVLWEKRGFCANSRDSGICPFVFGAPRCCAGFYTRRVYSACEGGGRDGRVELYERVWGWIFVGFSWGEGNDGSLNLLREFRRWNSMETRVSYLIGKFGFLEWFIGSRRGGGAPPPLLPWPWPWPLYWDIHPYIKSK